MTQFNVSLNATLAPVGVLGKLHQLLRGFTKFFADLVGASSMR